MVPLILGMGFGTLFVLIVAQTFRLKFRQDELEHVTRQRDVLHESKNQYAVINLELHGRLQQAQGELQQAKSQLQALATRIGELAQEVPMDVAIISNLPQLEL